MEIVGGFALADGTSAKALTGVDDYSRMCLCPVDGRQAHPRRPGCLLVCLPASRPATTLRHGTRVPAVEGLRLHGLRKSVAAQQYSYLAHFM